MKIPPDRRALLLPLRAIIAPALALYTLAATVSCDTAFGFNLKGYSSMAHDLEDAWRKTASFEYFADRIGYWKSPREFERDGGGDCEDFCTYLMYHLGEKSEMYIVRLNGREGNHAIVRFEGRFIEPQAYLTVYDRSDFRVLESLDYAETMRRTTFFGLKSERPIDSADLGPLP